MTRRTVAGSLVAAVALGAGSVVLGALASGYGPLSLRPDPGVVWLRHVSGWLGAPWAWGLLGMALGWVATRFVPAVLAATAGLLVAVVSYYVAKSAVGVTSGVDWDATRTWCAAAFITGPALGALGQVGRRRTWLALPAALVAPALMLADAQRGSAGPTRPGADALVLVAAALLGVALVARVILTKRQTATRHDREIDSEGRGARG